MSALTSPGPQRHRPTVPLLVDAVRDVRRPAAGDGARLDPRQLARDERADLADLLAGLPPERWDAPTLCEQWSVRDVVAHVVSYEGLGVGDLARRFVEGRFSLDRINGAGVARLRDRPPEQLLALLRQHLWPTGLTAGFGGRIALVDGIIHAQDVRRALDLPRTVPPERLRVALPFALLAPPIGAAWRARGLRLRATDLAWVAGSGPEVRGPAEALLMAVAGRRGVTAELAGSGRTVLAARIGD